MKEYLFKAETGNTVSYQFETDLQAQAKCDSLAAFNEMDITVFKAFHSTSNVVDKGLELAEKHLDDTIEEPSRTLVQKIEEDIFSIKVWGEFIPAAKYQEALKKQMDILRNPGPTCDEPAPLPYEKHQRKSEFLCNFDNAEELYNSSQIFRSMVSRITNGDDLYGTIETLIKCMEEEIVIMNTKLEKYQSNESK